MKTRQPGIPTSIIIHELKEERGVCAKTYSDRYLRFCDNSFDGCDCRVYWWLEIHSYLITKSKSIIPLFDKKPSVEVATYPDNFSLPPRIPNCRSLSSFEPNCKEHVSSFPLNVFFVASSNFSHICSMASLVPYFEPESFSDCSVR